MIGLVIKLNQAITKFKKHNYFLSNFFSAPVTYKQITYQNSEAAYQSMKCIMPMQRLEFASLSAHDAKSKGKSVVLRYDWNHVKDQYMYEIVKAKFVQNPELLERLLNTGDAFIEEGNHHGDKYWGTVEGKGRNKLGKILMRVRDELSQLGEDELSGQI